MLIDLNGIKKMPVPCMNGGTGTMTAGMYVDEHGKVITCAIHRGGSIGMHRHTTSDDINYVLSGSGKAICDGQEEQLTQGCCHICPKGSEHSIINTGSDDLVLLTIVVEK